jgi:hypothetical protein
MIIDYVVSWRGECDSLSKLPHGAIIEAIDDVLCIARCEACRKPILEGERMFTDSEGIELCGSCYDDMLKAEANG